MEIRPEFVPFIIVLAVAAYLCRVSGYFMMRFIPQTPRVDAALKAMPLAVMVGIAAPAAIKGGPAEWAAFVAIALIMRFLRNDVVAALLGVVVVAAVRQL